jgi:gamma-glutamyltranspeptidase/glutathione hydrolase
MRSSRRSLTLVPLFLPFVTAVGVLAPMARAAPATSAAAPGAPATAPAADVRVGPTVEVPNGVVVSVCPIASRVGCETLRHGGNAVDAAVATAFALAVTWPEAGNIGGGGFMMVRPAGDNTTPQFVDYRETAPAAVKADTFAGQSSSALLAGTPGTVRGLHLAFERFGSGKVAWKDLVAPAAELAEGGFTVDKALATSLNSGLRGTKAFPEMRRVYGKPDGSAWAAGDKLALPDLGKTLRLVAERGTAGFYDGPVAAMVAAEMKAGGGLMSADDLKAYQAVVRPTLTGTFNEFTIHAPPPPSSGGVAMLQILGMLGQYDIKREDRWSPRTIHLLVEATRRAYAERARFLGDPGFGDVPVAKLIDPAHLRDLGNTIDPAKASRSQDVAPEIDLGPETGGQTTHFSVVDAAGMAVANTYTLEQSFGGKIVVKGAGFLLNNELGDFNPRPGVTDRTGRIGTLPNQATGGKRPLSSMTPTIVTKGGKLVLVTGSPGGRTIINTVTQVVLNRLGFGMSLRDAVDAPRLHHQWFPDGIRFETAWVEKHQAVVDALKEMGHNVAAGTVGRQGDAHSIAVDPETGVRTGVADRRIGGGAAGY